MDPFQGKSPKMWLNEICVKQLAQIKYETSEKLPAEVPPRFISRCVVKYRDRDIEAEAMGKTKKEAEQEVAKEMLLHKLALTPAQFKALNDGSKKSVSANPVAEPDELTVSDTDDDELNSGANPIGELLGICSIQEFDTEPNYIDVLMEGPPHKRIYTVECSLVVPEKGINLSFIGRRLQKKMAKKLAALRVLRELNKLGYKYEEFEKRNSNNGTDGTGTNGDSESTVDTSNSNCLTPAVDEIQSAMKKIQLSEADQEKLMSVITGQRKRCDDSTGNCSRFCSNYTHVYSHTKDSQTLEDLLTQEEEDFDKTVENLGGASEVLKKIAEEMGVTVTWKTDDGCVGRPLVFVELEFRLSNIPDYVPKTSALWGQGDTEKDATQNATIEALKFFRLMFSS